MEQQDQGPGADKAPTRTESGSEPPQADESGADSTWGMGSDSALDHLRRNDFRARRSKRPDHGDRPQSE